MPLDAPTLGRRIALENNQFRELGPDEDADYELLSPNQQFSGHINQIPLPNAVQSMRPFYGARFVNQTLPLAEPETPWVQTLADGDERGRTFEDLLGDIAGNVRARHRGRVKKVTPAHIVVQGDDGQEYVHDLYDRFPFNRKSMIHNTPLVQEGDEVEESGLLARSNFTNDKGTLAIGANARIGLVPYRGYSMDDATVISQSFANRLSSEHLTTSSLKKEPHITLGREHFRSLFPRAYTADQLEYMDDDGIVQVGTTVQPGDPLILATRPKMVSSASTPLGNLSRVMRSVRSDASVIWEEDDPGEVIDVVDTKDGIKVNVVAYHPVREADKIVQRAGQKSTVSRIIPDEKMPRTEDGEPLDMIFNQLGLYSRVNAASLYEMLLGKVAASRGEAVRMPSFNDPDTPLYDIVQRMMDESGVSPYERVFDPEMDTFLDNPVLVGNAFVNKLHHTAHSKLSGRGMGAYTQDELPSPGGGEFAQSKRLSGLERTAMLSSGAYESLREMSSLRGAKNYEYWRDLRAGKSPKNPEAPLVWHKFRALLQGAGLNARELEPGRLRLGPFTDRDLAERKPIEVEYPGTIDLNTLQSIPKGLFDERLAAGNKWGQISLPIPVVNPAYEDSVRKLLGLTKQQFRDIMAGRDTLPEHLL